MTKPTRVRIGGVWFPVPNPWYLIGHPLKVLIKKLVIVEGKSCLGSCDAAPQEFEFVRESPSREAFMSLAIHEAVEYLNVMLELGLDHDRICQLAEPLGPFVLQWFDAQAQALPGDPPDDALPPGALARGPE